mgnify:CR=1 FL=1
MLRRQGFSLIELLVAVAVLSIVLAMAVPSLSQTRRSNEVKTVQSQLLNDLTRARGEAITRGNQVSLCASSDGLHCDGVWGGWLTFEGAVPASTTAIAQPLSVVSIAGLAVSATATQVTFAGWGAADAAMEATLCDSDADPVTTRAVQVSALGRARSSVDANADAVHESPTTGVALTCS